MNNLETQAEVSCVVTCELCERTFSGQTELKKHGQVNHGGRFMW